MTEIPAIHCPYCGASVEVSVDEGGGAHQVYVEDCPVCCQAWRVEVTRRPGGVWEVHLRTLDE